MASLSTFSGQSGPPKRTTRLRPPLRAVSLFSGAGGFCEGVRLAGYKIVCAVESDPSACLTHAANFPGVPLFQGDIRRFLVDHRDGVPSSGDFEDAPVDLVFGGPPCQVFSQIGPRDENDPRNLLYTEFVRVLKNQGRALCHGKRAEHFSHAKWSLPAPNRQRISRGGL